MFQVSGFYSRIFQGSRLRKSVCALSTLGTLSCCALRNVQPDALPRKMAFSYTLCFHGFP